jgi:catechol 2,3-dioxygenase-like lactoylglutathione lyase family enzyme
MDNSFLEFHHFGLAVRRRDEAERFLRALGYRIGETIYDPGQNVRLALCDHDDQPAVEIISPGKGSGPIDALVERQATGIIYHVCYETRNLAGALAALEHDGLKAVCVSTRRPAPLFMSRLVSFYNVIGIGLIEILEVAALASREQPPDGL